MVRDIKLFVAMWLQTLTKHINLAPNELCPVTADWHFLAKFGDLMTDFRFSLIRYVSNTEHYIHKYVTGALVNYITNKCIFLLMFSRQLGRSHI